MSPGPETRKRGPAAKSVLHAGSFFGIIFLAEYAGVAQLVVQLICNQQVGGSNPSTSSSSSRTPVRAKAPVEGPGLSTSLRRSSLPHENLLRKFSWGPQHGVACPMDCAPFKKPGRKTGLFSYRCVIPPSPHETLLCKLSRGPRKQVPIRSLSIFPYSLFTIHSSLNRQSRFLEGNSEEGIVNK